MLTGPELLTYDQAASIITSAVKYPVEHHRLTEKDLAQRLAGDGSPVPYAAFLASLDALIANGSEARLTEEVLRITGHSQKSFQTFTLDNQTAWRRKL